MIKTMSLLLPLIGAAYGVCSGLYIRSPHKTKAKKTALVISGFLIVSACITILILAFND